MNGTIPHRNRLVFSFGGKDAVLSVAPLMTALGQLFTSVSGPGWDFTAGSIRKLTYLQMFRLPGHHGHP